MLSKGGVTVAESKTKKRSQPAFKQVTVMIFITLFQMLSSVCVLYRDEQMSFTLVCVFAGYIVVEWLYMMIGTLATGTDYFELEAPVKSH